MNIKTTFVISTLMRDTLYRTLSKIRRLFIQYTDDLTEIPIYAVYIPTLNEYVVRNIAVNEYVKTEYVTFIDDDAYPDTNFYKVLEKYMDEGYDIITGRVFSNGMWFGNKYHGVGTNLTVKVSVFKELGGFEEDWGVYDFAKSGFGWRSDTDLLWRYLKLYGESKYAHSDELIVYHPEPFKSEFILPIEIKFIERHKDYVMKYFYDTDPRVVIVNDLFIDKKVSEKLVNYVRTHFTLTKQMFIDVMRSYAKYRKYLPEIDNKVYSEITKLFENGINNVQTT